MIKFPAFILMLLVYFKGMKISFYIKGFLIYDFTFMKFKKELSHYVVKT